MCYWGVGCRATGGSWVPEGESLGGKPVEGSRQKLPVRLRGADPSPRKREEACGLLVPSFPLGTQTVSLCCLNSLLCCSTEPQSQPFRPLVFLSLSWGLQRAAAGACWPPSLLVPPGGPRLAPRPAAPSRGPHICCPSLSSLTSWPLLPQLYGR